MFELLRYVEAVTLACRLIVEVLSIIVDELQQPGDDASSTSNQGVG